MRTHRQDAPPASFAVQERATKDLGWKPSPSKQLPLSVRLNREADSRVSIEFDLPEPARCLGLGERYCGLNLRGRVHTLFATDDHNHQEGTDSLYKAIPLLIVDLGDSSVGVFLDSPAPQRWDLDTELSGAGRIQLLTRRGFELYTLGPASVPRIVRAYTALTGRAALPPVWSLGHHQSRWSYPTQKTVLDVARQFRTRDIPCDVIVLDIDYMDGYRVFSVSKERFPDFTFMAEELQRQGMRLVAIVDPAVKRSHSDATYTDGLARGVFCRTAEGKPFVGKVWAGPSCLPDFLCDDVASWWAERLEFYARLGISGLWNDMNEPSLFDHQRPMDTTAQVLPKDSDQLFLQMTPEGPVGHFEVRNLYGSQMARAAHQSLLGSRPNERPFVLTRSAYAGVQRFSAVWLGDNRSWFEHLRQSIPMLLNMGLSGVPFCGVDVGGFNDDTDGELLARWYQVGIFYPFFRNHCALGRRPQEPWAFGPHIEAILRRLIEARYRLLPYIQGLFHEHRISGAPLMRPLSWHAPDDPFAHEVDDAFFFGKGLLVAPILQRGRSRRPVYLPRGTWYPFDGGPGVRGHRWVDVYWPLGAVPAFVRGGTVLPLADVVQHTGQLQDAAITFHCYGKNAQGRYYEDDGQSFDYLRGIYNDWRLVARNGEIEAKPVRRGWTGHKRPWFMESGGRRIRLRVPR